MFRKRKLTQSLSSPLTPLDHSEGDFGDGFDSKRCTDILDARGKLSKSVHFSQVDMRKSKTAKLGMPVVKQSPDEHVCRRIQRR